MLRLKRILKQEHISQQTLASAIGCSVGTINKIVNKSEFPQTRFDPKELKKAIEQHLQRKRISTEGIWELITKKGGIETDASEKDKEEAKMLPQKLLNDIKLQRDPFCNEILGKEDVWMPEQFHAAETDLTEAARRQLFFLLTGKTGSGKSIVSKLTLDKLYRDETYKIIRPEPMGTERLNAGSICDAIIFELEGPDAKTKRSLEAKARKVRYKLESLCREGKKVLLIIDEAHCLHHNTLRALKRLYELELGFRKMIGIILIGQEGIFSKLREHPDMLEVKNRIQSIEMPPINGQVPEYIRYKIARAGGDPSIFDDLALKELARRSDTPLQANVNASKALLEAWLNRKDKVSIQHVQAV